jgi:hypothetical protein
MNEGGWYDARSIIGLGFSDGKARKILSGLANADAVKIGTGKRGVTLYKPKIAFPNDPRLLRSISDVLNIQEISKTEATFISPKIEASDIMKRIELYWNAAVNNISVLYYPYYVCNLVTHDGSQRTDMIDAISGKLREL